MVSFALYLENVHDEMEHHLFRLMLLSVMALRMYIMLVSKPTFFLPILSLSIFCGCCLTLFYAHEDIVKMLSMTTAMFALLCFSLADPFDQTNTITTNMDRLKKIINEQVSF